MNIRTLAWWLLLGQISSVIFMSLVLIRQVKLLVINAKDGLGGIRWLLFMLALVVTLGNIVPVVVDTGTVLGVITRSTNNINPVGLFYSVSNTGTALLSALLIWLLYRMAGNILIEYDITERKREIASGISDSDKKGVE